MMSQLFLLVLLLPFTLALTPAAQAAIGCTLSNPAKDLKGLYPQMTSYREEVKELHKLANGEQLYRQLQERLGQDLDPIYEGYETPYTIYTVFQDRQIIGHVHGVNVAGKGGVIQVFLAVTPRTGVIEKMLFQRLESHGSKLLRQKEFRDLFAGLSLDNLKQRSAQIMCPPGLSPEGIFDCQKSIKGVEKNLLLLSFFLV